MTQKESFRPNIWKMYVVRLLVNMYFISAVLVPFYTQWGKIKFSQILFLNAWFMFWNFLLEIPTGTVADFLGRRVSMMMGCVVGAIGIAVYISSPNYIVFLIAEVIFSVSYTLLSGADEALAYDSLKELGETKESKKVLSRMESFKLTGIVVAAAAGGFIAKFMGLRMTMLMHAIPLFIAGIISFTLKEPPIEEQPSRMTFKTYKTILGDGFKFFWKNRILKILTLDMVIVNAVAWIIIWFYQALLMKSGVAMEYFGLVHSVMCVFQILIISNFMRMERLLKSKKRLLFLGAFITGVFYIILGVTSWAPLVIGGIWISAGFGLSRGPLFSSYMNKYIPSGKRATVLSTTSMLRTFAIVIVNSLAGILSDWSIPYTLLVLGVATIVFSFVSRIQEEHLID